jgi:transposase-like protein
MAKTKKRPRTSYSPKKRAAVLAAAAKDGLTAAQVQKRFGVKPVTYYSWRKKTGAVRSKARRAGRRSGASAGGSSLATHLRGEVQAKLRALLPGIVRSEVAAYLTSAFGGGGRGRR